MRKVNLRLIYAQLSGLGYDGPYAGRGGFDLIAQGMGGIMHVTGEPDGPPTSVGLPICDLGTGMWAVTGYPRHAVRTRANRGWAPHRMLAARNGNRLQLVDQRQWLADHEEPTRQGLRHRQNAPYQRMPDGGWLFDDRAGRRADLGALRRSLGTQGVGAIIRRFATNRQRLQNREALEATTEAVLDDRHDRVLGEVREAAGVPCGLVY